MVVILNKKRYLLVKICKRSTFLGVLSENENIMFARVIRLTNRCTWHDGRGVAYIFLMESAPKRKLIKRKAPLWERGVFGRTPYP